MGYPSTPMFPKKEKPKSEDCEIEIKQTAQGKKIKFKGKCKPEQIEMLKRENGMEV